MLTRREERGFGWGKGGGRGLRRTPALEITSWAHPPVGTDLWGCTVCHFLSVHKLRGQHPHGCRESCTISLGGVAWMESRLYLTDSISL